MYKFKSVHHDTLVALAFQVALINFLHGVHRDAIRDKIATPKDLLYSQVVRFKFDKKKSVALRSNPKRGIGFEEAEEIFLHPYHLGQRADRPEQYRAIGWVSGHLYSVILEIRRDKGGEYYHLVRCGKLQPKNKCSMKKTFKTKRTVSAESIARLADKGQDISAYFTNKGKMMPPLENLDLELNEKMLQELNEAARNLNVSRPTLIKRFIRRGLDQHYQKARKAG